MHVLKKFKRWTGGLWGNKSHTLSKFFLKALLTKAQ